LKQVYFDDDATPPLAALSSGRIIYKQAIIQVSRIHGEVYLQRSNDRITIYMVLCRKLRVVADRRK